ncbi:NUDIX domain-containing protein [Novosphingobium nitrogenifigens]|uniref:NUDIX domain-containing protein n=1 Tax=Novosphingobium nitrogenifigens TaxID=378548 RepID=UPI000305DC51|nr:NUDIX domain-containing protein [Novosphingobium nitrogenifigens]
MAEITSRTCVYDGWYRFYRIGVRLDTGVEVERHLLDNGSAVMVLPYDPDRRVVLLITQPRAGVLAAGETPIFEAIAGMLDGAHPVDRAREEAMEEGGLRLGDLDHVATVWSLPPVSTERTALYLARYGAQDRVGPGGGADGEHEAISVYEIPLDDLRGMVEGGTLTDAKTLILAQALMLRHQGLWNA